MPVAPKSTGEVVTASDWNALQAFQLDTIDLTSTTQFAAIPQDFRDLQIRLLARADAAFNTTAVRLQFNGDTGTNYFSHRWRVVNTSTSALTETGQTSAHVAQITAANANTSFFGSAIIEIPGYSDPIYRKMGRSESSAMGSGTVTTDWQRALFEFGRNGNQVITRIDISTGGSFIAGSRASLYGVGVL